MANVPQLYSLKIWKWEKDKSIELCDFENLSVRFSFFQRPTVREFIKFHARTVANKTEKGQRQTIKLTFEGDELGCCHTWVHPSGLAATCISDKSYNMRVGYTLISEALTAFAKAYPNDEYKKQTADTAMNFKEGQEMFDKFQNPEEADKILKIEGELDKIKDTVIQSMDDLLARGETLDSLMKKSDDLSASSLQFMRTAKRTTNAARPSNDQFPGQQLMIQSM